MVTVTDVRVAEDLRDASVYVTVQGDEHEHDLALRALRHAAPYLRKQLGFSLNLRHTPALHFVRDTVEEQAERTDALLGKVEYGKDEGCRMKDEKGRGELPTRFHPSSFRLHPCFKCLVK